MLYTKIDALSDSYKYDVEVSYVEIYNENMKDLLSPGQFDDLPCTSPPIDMVRFNESRKVNHVPNLISCEEN